MKKLTLIFTTIALVGFGTSFTLSQTYAKEGFGEDLFNHFAHKVAGPLRQIDHQQLIQMSQAKSIEIEIKSADIPSSSNMMCAVSFTRPRGLA